MDFSTGTLFLRPFISGLLLLLQILTTNLTAQQIAIKNYSKSDYRAEYQNWDLDVGPDNYIYTANNAGLLVFDGVNWDFFTSPEINNIRSVMVDERSGRVYTSGYREIGYWDWDSLGNLNYHSYNSILKDKYTTNEEFWRIVRLGEKVIFHSFQSLYVLSKDEFEIVRPGGFMNTISVIGDQLYIHFLNRGIYIYEEDTLQPYIIDPFFSEKIVRFILPGREGGLLIGTASDGIYSFDGEKFIEEYLDFGDFFRRATINRACIRNDSTLVIGTILDGIIGLNLEGDLVFHINEDDGLQNNTVLAIKSMTKDIWLALDRGVSYLNMDANQSYKIHTTNNIGASYSAALYKGKFYLGTNQGLYSKAAEEADTEFSLVPGTQDQVWDCQVYDDKLFVCHNTGTFVIDDDEMEKISDVGGGFNLIKNSYQLNTLIQSSYANIILYEKENGEWRIKHNISGFSDLIRYIELDHLNNIWAGHMRRGVYKLRLNDAQDSVIESNYFGESSVFKQEYGVNVFKVENRIIFTTGERLYTYDDLNDTIIEFNQVNNQLGDYISAHRIIKAPDHHYWFIDRQGVALFEFTNRGVNMIKEYPAEIFASHIIEGYENVIPISATKAIYCLENGYAILDAQQEENRDRFAVKDVIPREISVADRSGNIYKQDLKESKFVIPYTRNSLKLQYALPEYSSRKYEFKLYIEGLHSQWISSDNNASFEINRIPAGEYVVNVLADNEWHQQSSAHQFYLKILQPWYRSIVAWISYSVSLFLLLLWVRYISVKRIKTREKKKRDLKEQELIKLRNQNLRADLKYKSRELANSTMSIIKKNEFLLDLKDILKDQKYQLGTRYPDKFYNHVVKKIDKNISAGDDWKIFETNVDNAHEFFLQKLINEYPQLTHSDLRLCTYLRMNLSSKEIAPLMRISVRGVENHRYRLRKKLKLKADVNLTDFILAFEV